MVELTVLPNNLRLKLLHRIFTPFINMTPSYTRGLYRAYTYRHKIYTYKNIFIKTRSLFK